MLGHGPLTHNAIANIVAGVQEPPHIPTQPIRPQNDQLDQGGKLPQAHRTYGGPTSGAILTTEPFNLDMVFDGINIVLEPGIYSYLVIPTWLRLLSWSLVSPQIGSFAVDIWRLPLLTVLAGTQPSSANSICGAARPSFTADDFGRSFDLSAWTTLINKDDVLAFNIVSSTDIFKATLSLLGQRLRLQ